MIERIEWIHEVAPEHLCTATRKFGRSQRSLRYLQRLLKLNRRVTYILVEETDEQV